MTVSINFVTVADAIAGLTITGVTVKDIDQVDASNVRLTSILAPRPLNYITDISAIADSLGAGGNRQMTLLYTLHYTYYYLPIGSTLSFEKYNTLIANVATILAALITNDVISGALYTENISVDSLGLVTDPRGDNYFGCEFSLQIAQFIN